MNCPRVLEMEVGFHETEPSSSATEGEATIATLILLLQQLHRGQNHLKKKVRLHENQSVREGLWLHTSAVSLS
ncbi:hypothetical protein QN277_024611 [Acacia crassicarpa]|uniref:Uncharacterized protein n=1 Tax=Acacia crassicarpa TaxID=499986 RepID=A0AAE1JF63_9FABA|nr:hypothetical protein QN277_024611 [Acacia crassicarpa]